MPAPTVIIDLEKIEHNARFLTELCAGQGIEIVGVSKSVWGSVEISTAILNGGVSGLAESRLENIRKLRAAGFAVPLWLLRLPALSEVEPVVQLADISLNSELAVIGALSETALVQGKKHKIILMVDLGDLREGILPEDLFFFVEKILECPGVELVGLGTNLSCYGGVIPTEENLGRLVSYARQIEKRYHLRLRYISGGNSSSLPLLMAKKMPEGINHLRLGESILLGRETIGHSALDGVYQDAFFLEAEIIEKKRKASIPTGEIGEDAFGDIPVFEEKGEIERAIVGIGRADIDIAGIVPVDPGIFVLGASSDHLLLDITAARKFETGDVLRFSLNYSSLLRVMLSPSVTKKWQKSGEVDSYSQC